MSWIIAGSQPSTGLLAIGVRFALRPAKSASWIIAGSQPSTGLLAIGVRFAATPRKILRTRITRLKPCACSSPRVHKFNININTGDGGRRSISTGFALEILR